MLLCQRHNIRAWETETGRQVHMPPISPNVPVYRPGPGYIPDTQCYLLVSRETLAVGQHGACEIVEE